MPSENQRRHSEVQAHLTNTDHASSLSPTGRYWSGAEGNNGLEREHAREEAAIEKRLARMKSRSMGFATLQAQ